MALSSSALNPPELTCRVLIIACILTLLLAISNAYLALKLGILTSASIPAAMLSMGILRLLKQPSILENNLVQTAASAGEAVAGGIVYTIPALIIIGYWDSFSYFENVIIAACGGVLGVLFSIPLRRILVHDATLPFPEGRAIAEVLQVTAQRIGIRELCFGGLWGALLELCQAGLHILSSAWSSLVAVGATWIQLGFGFSATMLGAGFLMGKDMVISVFIGSITAGTIITPWIARHVPHASEVSLLWNTQGRYVGIGAMLYAGLWTFLRLTKPLCKHILLSANTPRQRIRTERDMPMWVIGVGILLVAIALGFFFQHIFPLAALSQAHSGLIPGIAVLYVLVVGAIFSVVTAYLSGMVGVTASPGSAIVIAGMLFAAWGLLSGLSYLLPLPLTGLQRHAAEAITIIIGSVVTGIAAIANDNTQDLKVGQLVGATPWKQQLMLLLGVLVAACIIPPVMQVLFNVYGIAGVMPHAGMDKAASLPAPAAALMAAVTEAVFEHTIPWGYLLSGVFFIMIIQVLTTLCRLERWIHLSIFGVAIGMYLPVSTSMALFCGGMMASLLKYKNKVAIRDQVGVLIACGLVAGAALMDVILAIPFSMAHSADVLSLVNASFAPWALIGAVIMTYLLYIFIRIRMASHA